MIKPFMALRMIILAAALLASSGCGLLPFGKEWQEQGPKGPMHPEARIMKGQFIYLADAPLFRECASGVTYPVAMEGDYPALEKAYLQNRAGRPGAGLLVVIEARIEKRPRMEGGAGGSRTERFIVVDRFIEALNEEVCPANHTAAVLTETRWRIVSLMGRKVPDGQGIRPSLLLLKDEPAHRYMASVGCNRLMGSYWVDGEKIGFSPPASTRMGCPGAVARLEALLSKVLQKARTWKIEGRALKLMDQKGVRLAVFQAE